MPSMCVQFKCNICGEIFSGSGAHSEAKSCEIKDAKHFKFAIGSRVLYELKVYSVERLRIQKPIKDIANNPDLYECYIVRTVRTGWRPQTEVKKYWVNQDDLKPYNR